MKSDVKNSVLQSKHESLTKDFLNLKSLHEQLLSEAPNESNDPRRNLLLKNQLFLLERQCHNMSVQLNERQVSLQHVHTTLDNVSQDIEKLLTDAPPGPGIQIKRTDLTDLVKSIRGVTRKMNKPSESCEVVEQRYAMKNKFSEELSSPSDIFNYNIKQMSNLEHKLCELTTSMEHFKSATSDRIHQKPKIIDHISSTVGEFKSSKCSYEASLATLTKQLNECCYDITLLSLLQPQIPLKNRKISQEIDMDTLLLYLKKFTRKKEVFDVVPLAWQLAHHHAKIFKMKATMLENEVGRCQQRLELHTEFVLDILNGIKGMFLDFENNSLSPILIEPLSSLIQAYVLLQNEQTDSSFTDFFKTFNELIPELERIVKLLKKSVHMQDSSELQNMFKKGIYSFTKDCLAERNRNENAMMDLEKANNVRREKLSALLNMTNDLAVSDSEKRK